jgi:cytochrome b pre-mRNA-processing protein 3
LPPRGFWRTPLSFEIQPWRNSVAISICEGLMFGLFRNRTRDAVAARLYAALTQAARHPVLFVDHGVPDTVEGRYDMMVLHLFLLVRRLQTGSIEVREIGQTVCDRFFTEMDRAMREMGVGDLTVPKKMTKIAKLYAGCSQAYAGALAKAGNEALAAALLRNVYEGEASRAPKAAALAAYVRAAAASLEGAPEAELVDASLPYPDPASFAASSA